MSTTGDAQRALTTAMSDELAGLPLAAVIAWGNAHFSGLDSLLRNLEHNPDGSPANPWEQADVLGAWAARLQAFAAIIQSITPAPAPAPPAGG